jgi:hypothetical protein
MVVRNKHAHRRRRRGLCSRQKPRRLGKMQLCMLLVSYNAELARRIKRPMMFCRMQSVVAIETWQRATGHL